MRTKKSLIRAEVSDSAESAIGAQKERAARPEAAGRFPKRERLKGRGEIRAVFNRRNGVSCSGARLFMLKNGLSYNRIAFTFTRKFGSAVERNRSRRISRHAYRYLRQFIKPGWDLILLIYPEASDQKSGAKLKVRQTADRKSVDSRTALLKELLSRARILENPRLHEARLQEAGLPQNPPPVSADHGNKL